MATIAQRINEALKIRDMKQADLVRLTGIGKSSISTYISGEYEPKQRNIYKIALALNVNEAWLMGYDVPMDRKKLNLNSEDELRDPLTDQIMELVQQLSPENKKKFIEKLKVLLEFQEPYGDSLD